jgi:hypothetical protein
MIDSYALLLFQLLDVDYCCGFIMIIQGSIKQTTRPCHLLQMEKTIAWILSRIASSILSAQRRFSEICIKATHVNTSAYFKGKQYPRQPM